MNGAFVSILKSDKQVRYHLCNFENTIKNGNLLLLFIYGSKISIITEISGSYGHSLQKERMFRIKRYMKLTF